LFLVSGYNLFTMPTDITRRETFRRGLAAASLLALLPEGAIPALAQGESDLPFTDYPKDYKVNGNPNAANRFVDIRKIDGHITPNDQFFFIQHYNRPEVNAETYRLSLTGMFQKPVQLSLADLKAMKSTEIVNGYECSGNSGRFFQGLSSCGRFTGGHWFTGSRGGLLRYRSGQGRRGFPGEYLQAGTAVRTQHHIGACFEARAAARIRAQRPTPHARPGFSGAADHAWLVWSSER
jgi:hypothetical protein